jgi:Trypsin
MKRTILLTITIATTLWPAASLAAERPNIVGGQPGTLPSIALVQWSDSTYDYTCTGTVVSPTVILTAAHCATGDPTSYTITTFPGSNPVDSSVTQVISYPTFDEDDNDVNDVAVLVLSTPTTAPGIPLDPTEPVGGTGALITGFGETYEGSGISGIANYAPTVVQSNRFCTNYSGSDWASSDMCALDYPNNDTSTGSGDSGGPLVVQRYGQVVEAGITDRGVADDDTSIPQIFTRIDEFYSWAEGLIDANGGGAPALASAPSTFAAPRLRGDNTAQARRAVRAHYRIGKIYHVRGTGVGHGHILRQSPQAGTKHVQGSVINVWERGSRVTNSGSVGGRG